MSIYSREKGYDLFEDDEDESLSEDYESSSEDEINIILHGTPEQRRKLQHNQRIQKQHVTGKKPIAKSSSEDEFEKEMTAELNQQVKFLEESRGKNAVAGSSLQLAEQTPTTTADVNIPTNVNISVEGNVTKNVRQKEEYYDDVYFDSEDEDEESSGIKISNKGKHAVISNDDLLYDPDMDDQDQKWVDRQRSVRHNGSYRSNSGKAPSSDALLDCPACMTTLCLDCQRHESYKNQYRAMFVMNCTVDQSETLEYPEQAPKKKKKKPQETAPQALPSKDLFNPVRCIECKTVVGVIDKDEVYHFFNVLASHT